MDIRDGGVRHPRSVVVKIERRGNELAHLVPEERQLQVGQMNRHQQGSEG